MVQVENMAKSGEVAIVHHPLLNPAFQDYPVEYGHHEKAVGSEFSLCLSRSETEPLVQIREVGCRFHLADRELVKDLRPLGLVVSNSVESGQGIVCVGEGAGQRHEDIRILTARKHQRASIAQQ
jgi:hypothetical protein